MSQLFLKILNISLYAAILISAVMLLRVLFKKAPKWISCLFWALVAVRLLCPFTIESPFGLTPATEKLPTAVLLTEEKTESADAAVTAKQTVENAEIQTAEQAAKQTAIETAVSPKSENAEVVKAESKDGKLNAVRLSDSETSKAVGTERGNGAKKADLIRIFAIIWLVGFCVMMGQALFSYIRLKHSVAASVRIKRNIRICDEIRYPFILGIVRPMIYLPGFLEGDMKRFVLAHERAHLTRRDHWWKPLGFFLLAVHWFNPLCWIAYILFCRDLEMACDERVIKNMDRESKADYSETLLLLSSPAKRITACPVAFGEIGVKERVKGIINYKKPAVWIVLLAIAGCMVLSACFLTSPVNSDTDIIQDEVETGTTEEQPEVSLSQTGENENEEVPVAAASAENQAMNGEAVFTADIDANGQDDYIYMYQLPDEEMTDDHMFDWALMLNGEQIYTGAHVLFCEFDAWSMDLDADGKDEIVVKILPHVNSMPLEEYAVLKQTGDTWTELQNSYELGQKDENGDSSNAFPVSVTATDKSGVLDIQVVGAEKYTVDVKEHYEDLLENERGTDLHELADGFLNKGKYAAGDEFGTTAAWGIWDIDKSEVDGVPCLCADEGIKSIEGGKMDVLGTMYIYFNYGTDGKINILKTEFEYDPWIKSE